MKTIYFAVLAISLTLIAGTGCSKQEDTTATLPQVVDSTQKVMPEQMAEPPAAEAQLNNVVQDESGKTVLYWYDPMVPNKYFDKPGKSPFMDMQLVPKYAGGADERGQP